MWRWSSNTDHQSSQLFEGSMVSTKSFRDPRLKSCISQSTGGRRRSVSKGTKFPPLPRKSSYCWTLLGQKSSHLSSERSKAALNQQEAFGVAYTQSNYLRFEKIQKKK